MKEEGKFPASKQALPSDFPEGLEVIDVETAYAVTDRICEECNGTRGKLTHTFKITKITLRVQGEDLDFEDFRRRYPETATYLKNSLSIGTFVNPTCFACQEDMRMRFKKMFDGNEIEDI